MAANGRRATHRGCGARPHHARNATAGNTPQHRHSVTHSGHRAGAP